MANRKGRVATPRRIVVHFACNDPRNGEFDGRASACKFDRWELELSHNDWERGAAFTVDYKMLRFRIHRVWFPFTSSKEWVGNWCWNAYAMKRPQALRLILLLRDHDWTCEGGALRMCEWWERRNGEHGSKD